MLFSQVTKWIHKAFTINICMAGGFPQDFWKPPLSLSAISSPSRLYRKKNVLMTLNIIYWIQQQDVLTNYIGQKTFKIIVD